MTAVGLLYPGFGAEDDFPALERRLRGAAGDGYDVCLPLVHTSVGEDAHRVDALLDLGGHERLVEGARSLAERHRLDSLMWACTSGSFVFGWDGARRQVEQLTEATGLPTSSTSLAFVEACRALDLTRVSIAASYPEEVAAHFRAFLRHGGVEVTAMGSHGIYTAAEVGRLGRDQVMAIVLGADRKGAQAVVVPDTAMHSLAWIPDLEAAAGMPVLTANQVTVFEGLRLAGSVPVLPQLGTLFQRAHVEAR
jgi:maleate cis-trans isomerase